MIHLSAAMLGTGIGAAAGIMVLILFGMIR